MDITPTDLSNLITAGATAASVLGGGMLALWSRIESINKQTKAELENCKHREVVSRERRSILITAFEFALHALSRHDPGAPEIEQSRGLITDLKTRDRLEEAMIGKDRS